MGITLAELARHLNAKLEGQGKENGDACVITGIAALDTAKPGQVSFLSNARYRKALATTQASAVILSPADRAFSPVPVLILDNPYLGYAQAAQLFSTSIQHHPGIHPTASIGRGADIHPSASVGAYCVIGDDVQIGAESILYPHVTIYHEVHIGERAIIHSGVVIGSDGFGFAKIVIKK